MKRKEALNKFSEENEEGRKRTERTFRICLTEQIDEMMKRIYTALEDIAQQAQDTEKEFLTFFSFSLQRYDLTEGKTAVRLDAMGPEWYLDQRPLQACFDLTFLFQAFFEWKKELLLVMRPYGGKVNRYDVEYFVQEEIMAGYMEIAGLLHYAFRNLETVPAFSQIPRLPVWFVHWGEYKDYSQVVCQVNREIRGQAELEKSLAEQEDELQENQPDYWFGGSFTGVDCRDKSMRFTVFENCSLTEINFEGADLEGARFLNCRIEKCHFKNTKLYLVEFKDCLFYNDNFAGASLKMAVFDRKSFNAGLFEEKQLKELLVETKKTV